MSDDEFMMDVSTPFLSDVQELIISQDAADDEVS